MFYVRLWLLRDRGDGVYDESDRGDIFNIDGGDVGQGAGTNTVLHLATVETAEQSGSCD